MLQVLAFLTATFKFQVISFRTELTWLCPFNIVRSPLKECFPTQDGEENVQWKYKVINPVPQCIIKLIYLSDTQSYHPKVLSNMTTDGSPNK